MMDRRIRSCVGVVAAFTLVALAGEVEAQERRGPRPTHVSGESGIRPFLGATGDLNIHGARTPPPVSGNVLVLGADLYFGPGSGLAYALGLHMGMGDATLYLQPLFEVHYRFETPIPLVPWVGGGASMKFGFRANQQMNMALTFRFVTGIEYFITDTIGIGMQLAIPDVGPRLLPSILPIGNIEWIIGPHFRF